MSENQIEQLEKLKSLFDNGTISKEEMEKLKKDILNVQKKSIWNRLKINHWKSIGFISLTAVVILSIFYYFYSRNNGAIDKSNNDLGKFKLNGKVKYLKTASSESEDIEILGFNKDGFLVYKEGINDDDNFCFNGYFAKELIERNKLNQIVLSEINIEHYDEGTLFLDSVDKKFQYDNFGKIIEEKKIYTSFGSPSSTKTSFKYDDKGNIVEEKVIDGSGSLINETKIKYKYDEIDSIIEEVITSIDYSRRTKYSYNENHLLIKKEDYDSNGELQLKIEYSYDKNDNLIQETNSPHGFKKIFTRYIYDNNNYLIRVDEMVEGKDWVRTIEYKNDDKGNWIKKMNFSNNKPILTESREIVYYSDEELKDDKEFDFRLEFGFGKNNMSNTENIVKESSNSYGEIRGRIIGGNLRLVERELGSASYNENGANFIKNSFNMSLPMGLFDHCLGFRVYVYESYFGDGQNLLVIINEDGKVSNVLSQNDIEDVREICCCE